MRFWLHSFLLPFLCPNFLASSDVSSLETMLQTWTRKNWVGHFSPLSSLNWRCFLCRGRQNSLENALLGCYLFSAACCTLIRIISLLFYSFNKCPMPLHIVWIPFGTIPFYTISFFSLPFFSFLSQAIVVSLLLEDFFFSKESLSIYCSDCWCARVELWSHCRDMQGSVTGKLSCYS